MDTTGLRVTISQVYSVGEDGQPAALVSELHGGLSCVEHGAAFGSWDAAREHCETVHGDGLEGADDLPIDGTRVGEFHRVTVEPPAEYPQ